MPILVPPQPGSPLTQGDILDEVAFATCGTEGNLEADSTASYVMVVSRPCRALREPHVMVAPVRPWKLDLEKVATEASGKGKADAPPQESLDRMRRLLAGVRDGGQLTDAFYLGEFEHGSMRRFSADLSALSTQRIPTENRQAWVDDHRVAALDPEFARDLHVRLFNAFARLGFDDHRWYSDADLSIMVTSGKREIAELEAKALDAERALQQADAQGRTPGQKQRQEAENLRKRVEATQAALAPYLAEQQRRLEQP